MASEFNMAIIGQQSFFLWATNQEIKKQNICQPIKVFEGYTKKFGIEDAKLIRTPMATNGYIDWDKGGNPVDQK